MLMLMTIIMLINLSIIMTFDGDDSGDCGYDRWGFGEMGSKG